MLFNNISIIYSKTRKFYTIALFFCVACVIFNVSVASYDDKIEGLIEIKTPETRQELRAILIDIFPASYIFEYRLIKDIITYSLGTLGTKLAIDKNTAYSKGYLSGSILTGIPTWGNIAIYKGKSKSYKYYPAASWHNYILTLGLNYDLLLHHRIGVMMNYSISQTKISYTVQEQQKGVNFKVSKPAKTINNRGVIFILHYQYLDNRISVDCSLLAGQLQQKINKKINWLPNDYKVYYKPKLYNANLNLNYPCFINKFYLDIILSNSINLIKNPDVNIQYVSNIEHSSIKLLKTGAGVKASYSFQLTTDINIYSTIELSYNHSFYLDGKSKIGIMYLGKDFYIQDYLLEKNSFNANLDIILKVDKSFNIGMNVTWIKERYSSSAGGRLLLYYYF